MSKITYTDKEDFKVSYLPESKKVTASNLNEIKTSLNALYDEVDAIDVGTLATDVATLQGEMVTAQADIVTNAGDITTNTSNIATNSSDINILQNAVITAETDISNLESDVTDLQAKMTTVIVTNGQDYTLVPNNVNDIVIVNNDSTTDFDVIGTINGQTNFTLYADESLSLTWTGTEWRVI